MIPTQITKIASTYFIVDCHHDRILYNDTLDPKIFNWKFFTYGLLGPHSIAGDGNIYLVDDTENNRIAVFLKDGDRFVLSQHFQSGSRPHVVIYAQEQQLFYAISFGGRIDIFKNIGGQVERQRVIHIKELENSYVRSMTIIDGYIYAPSANGKIYKIAYEDNSFRVVACYTLPQKAFFNMIYITKIGNYYYLTVFSNDQEEVRPQFIRFTNFEALLDNNYEDIYKVVNFDMEMPYYISKFDGKYFFTQLMVRNHQSVERFSVSEDRIGGIETLYKFTGNSRSTMARHNANRANR